MKIGLLRLVAGAALVMGLGVAMSPPKVEAVPISSVIVTVRNVTWCNTGNASAACVGANFIWTLPGGDLAPGQQLALSQTNGFNFDTSEPGGVGCATPGGCLVTISINGTNITGIPADNPINALNKDTQPPTSTKNEAVEFSNVFSSGLGGFSVALGYFDNIHTDACADSPGQNGGNGDCSPGAFPKVAGLAVGTSGVGSGVSQGGANHCSVTVASTTCWDAGVILITANATTTTTPEPSALLLLGSGLLGVVSMIRRNRR